LTGKGYPVFPSFFLFVDFFLYLLNICSPKANFKSIAVKEYTDSEIIECLRERKGYVVRYLHDKYMPMIRLMVLQNNGSADDALDIFQEGLIIILERLDNDNLFLTCKFKTFFYSVCRNLWSMVLKERNAEGRFLTSGTGTELVEDTSENMDSDVYQEIFRSVFESLDNTGKEILTLYWKDVPMQQIADKLGLSYGYVKKKKSEAQAEIVARVRKHPEYRIIMNNF